MGITFRVNNDPLVALIRDFPKRSHRAVDESAKAIRDLASQLAPRDTGSLSVSLYVGTPDGSDYGQASAAAQALNPEAKIIPEVRPEFVMSLESGNDGLYVDVVGFAVEHGLFQEFGTRYQSAQPFLFPAIENERTAFVDRMRGIV